MLRDLGLTSEQLASHAQIAPLVKQCGITPARIIEVLRGDQDENSIKVIALWDKLTPYSRSAAGLEGVALGVGIPPRRLWELYAGATMMQSWESVGVMIADALPAIMRVTIKQAKTKDGFTSREHILKAARVLPVPKGSTTNINVGGNNQSEQNELGDGGEEGAIIESADDFLMRASRAMGAKQLPAPTIEADVDESDDEGDE